MEPSKLYDTAPDSCDRLQGGYNLSATAAGVEATLRVLLGERPLRLAPARPSQLAMLTISQAVSIQVLLLELEVEAMKSRGSGAAANRGLHDGTGCGMSFKQFDKIASTIEQQLCAPPPLLWHAAVLHLTQLPVTAELLLAQRAGPGAALLLTYVCRQPHMTALCARRAATGAACRAWRSLWQACACQSHLGCRLLGLPLPPRPSLTLALHARLWPWR